MARNKMVGEHGRPPALPGGLSDARSPAVQVRSSGKRKPSSTRWLSRQLNDPYVVEAHRLGYRSRAAFKLLELDRRFGLLRPRQRVVDLGCAPGGWTQVAVERVGTAPKGQTAGLKTGGRGVVVGVDLAIAAPLAGATLLRADLCDPMAIDAVMAALGGLADVVLSDMAPPATGHAATDHLRIVALAEAGFAVASAVLAPGGSFVAKVFQGGAEGELLVMLKQAFAALRHAKPPASRAESAETYIVAKGFRRTA